MGQSITRTKPFSVLLVFLGFFLMSSVWALSMPIGAGPDEPAHILKAASVARGEFLGSPSADNSAATVVRVPAALGEAHSWACFAFDPMTSGACQIISESAADADGLVAVTTTAGLYNPAYYFLVGGPTLLGLEPVATVMSMRVLAALVSSVLMAWMFQVMSRIIAPLWALTVIAVAATPMVFFLNGIVNPNSFEILGGAAFLVALLWFAITPNPRERNWSPLLLMVVGGALGANARGVSPMWMFLAGVLFLILTPQARLKTVFTYPRFLIGLGVVVLAAIFGVAWVLKTGTLNQMGDFPGQNSSPAGVFFRMLLNAPSDPGLIAFFGWLDTPAPGFVYAVYGFGILSLVIAGIVYSQGRWRVGVFAAISSFFLVPAILQAASLKSSGFIWQGRYSLVALVLLLIICGYSVASNTLLARGSDAELPKPLVTTLGLALTLFAVAQFWAFFSNMQRYTVAVGGSPFDVLTSPDWQPPVLGTIPLTGLFGVAVVLLAVVAVREAHGAPILRSQLAEARN